MMAILRQLFPVITYFFYANDGVHGNELWALNTITGIKEENKILDGLNLYPNPTVEELNFSLDAKTINANKINYSVTNILGQQCINGYLTTSKLNVSNLVSGVYFISIKISATERTFKFIKQ